MTPTFAKKVFLWELFRFFTSKNNSIKLNLIKENVQKISRSRKNWKFVYFLVNLFKSKTHKKTEFIFDFFHQLLSSRLISWCQEFQTYFETASAVTFRLATPTLISRTEIHWCFSLFLSKNTKFNSITWKSIKEIVDAWVYTLGKSLIGFVPCVGTTRAQQC